MSKYNNVNPGQYKTAGRERPDTLADARLKVAKPKAAVALRQQKNRQKRRKQA